MPFRFRAKQSTFVDLLFSSVMVCKSICFLQILEIAGYKVDMGADFKLFAVIAALSQKIAELELWSEYCYVCPTTKLQFATHA